MQKMTENSNRTVPKHWKAWVAVLPSGRDDQSTKTRTRTRFTHRDPHDFQGEQVLSRPLHGGWVDRNGSENPSLVFDHPHSPPLPCLAMTRTDGSNNSCNASTSLNPILSYFATKSEIFSWRNRTSSLCRVQSQSAGTFMVNSGICFSC